jgi:SAM-dependent methyltransferase
MPMCICGCQGRPLIVRGERQNRWFKGEIVGAWRCEQCAYVFWPTPDADDLTEYYQTMYPESAKSWYTCEADYNPERVAGRVYHLKSVVTKYGLPVDCSTHEAGCSFGGTVFGLRQAGFDATGTELNSDAIEQGKGAGNEGIFAEDAASFLKRTGRTVHLLYSFHALEHMPDPVSFLVSLRECLRPDSVCSLYVPNGFNLLSVLNGYTSHIWFAYPDHLHMYSPRSLLWLAEKAGYEVLEVVSNCVLDDEEEQFGRLFKAATADPVTKLLSRRMAETSLMGSELHFILTPVGSDTARRNEGQIRHTRERLIGIGDIESRLMDLAEHAPQREAPHSNTSFSECEAERPARTVPEPAVILTTPVINEARQRLRLGSIMDAYGAWEVANSGHNAATVPTPILRRIEQLLPHYSDASVETGCGNSTILFSNISRHHKVFALDDQDQEESHVRFFMDCPLTDHRSLEFIPGHTQLVLPTYRSHLIYDFVFIDGPHGYPFPELEYFFLYPHIRAGGMLIIDDVNIPTIGRLADFLAEDEMFELVEIVSTTAVFRRTERPLFSPHGDGWWEQRYNRRRVSSSREIFLNDTEPVDQITNLKLDRELHC